MHRNKNSSIKDLLIYGLIIGIFLLLPKISFAALYQPGETLDPACLPTDVNCGVYPSVSLTTSTYSVGDLLFASTTDSFGLLNIGLNGQFLKSTGSSIVWDSLPGGGDLLSTNNLSELSNITDARLNLGLVIGSDVQAYNAGLADIAGLSLTNGNFIVSDGVNWTSQSSSTVKTTLGLGNVENTALSLWTGSSNITTLGTIVSGVWNGTKIVSSSLADNIMVEGENISLFNNNSGYVTSTEALALLSSNALGLTYNNTNGQFSLTSGYNIPLTASTTNWNSAYDIVTASSTNWESFYNTPSSRISLGAGLAWNSNTIQADTGYNIPLTASTTNWNNTYNTVTASSSDWTTAFDWGDHSLEGYLTSYNETDPIWNSVSSTYLATTTASNTYLAITNNLSDLNNVTTARTNLGLAIGTNVQAYNLGLANIAGLTIDEDAFIVGKSGEWVAESGATARTSLGLGNVENTALSIWAGSSNITTLGTIVSGVWNGTKIVSSSLADNIMVEGENISLFNNNSGYVTSTEALALLSSSALGLTYNNTTGDFSLTAGYNIPLTASTTNWNDFYDTPSSKISLGTGLAWNSNTIQADTGYNIPLTASTTNWNNTYNTVTASSSDWTTAFDWGDHSLEGYLTSYNETDPIWNSVSSTYLATTTANSTYLSQVNAASNYLSLSSWYATTTDALTEGSTNKYYADTLARAAFSVSGSALFYDSGTGTFSVSSTYDVPLLASTTEWSNFYNTPSSRISLGAGLAWNSNTIQADTGYNIPLTASTTNWQTAFDWGDHAGVGYLTSYNETDPIWNSVSSTYLATTTAASTYLSIGNNLSDLNSSSTARTNLGLGTLALQNLDGVAITGGSINGTTIGASTPSTAVFTNATSTNLSYSGGLTTPFTQGSVLFVGANGLLSQTNSSFFWDSSGGRLGIGTNTFQTTNPALEVQGVSELKSRVIAGRDLGTAGWQTVYSMWAFGAERPVIAKNNTTGKIGYMAEGGTQGLAMFTAGRSIVFDGRTQVGTTKFTASSGDGLIHLDGVADFNNAAVTYRGIQYNFIDSASAAGSLILDLQKSGTSQFAVRKDGNVGINTSTPGYKLTIAGVTGATENALYIMPSSDGTSERASLALDNWEVGQDYNADGTKNFYIKDTASSTARFFIDKQGNVGVGTTTPQSAFHLASGSFTQTVGSDPVILGTLQDSNDLYAVENVFVSGHYLYTANGQDRSITIIDIADSYNPVKVGNYQDVTNLEDAHDLYVVGKYAYVISDASTGDAFEIIDISNPSNPTLLSKMVGYGGQSLDISGHVVTLDGHYFIDVSNPYNPVEISTSSLSLMVDVKIQGKYAYAVGNDTLNILDMSNIESPVLVGSYTSSTVLSGINSIDILGGYAYVTNGFDNSMRILNVTDPTNPLLLGGVKDATNLSGVNSVKVFGRYAYITSPFNNSISIIDISDSNNPQLLTTVQDNTEFNSAQNIFVSGKYAYVAASGNNSIAVVNLTGIDAPTANIGNIQSNSINVTDNFNVGNDSYLNGGLVVGGNSLFGGAMSINGSFKQSITADPVIVGSVVSSTILNGANSIYVSDKYAYVASNSSDSLEIFDITIPNNPTWVGGVVSSTVLNGASSVYVSGRYAYVLGSSNSSLSVVDVSNHSSPEIVGTVVSANLDFANSIYVSGEYAYYTSPLAGYFGVVDISNPSKPVLGNAYFIGAFTSSNDVYIKGNYAYVTVYNNNAVYVFDISNPASISLSDTILVNSAEQVFVSGRYAYVSGSDGLVIMDISDPTNVSTTTVFSDSNIGAYINDIYVAGDYAYILNGNPDNSLVILDVSDPYNPRDVAMVQSDTVLGGAYSIFVSGKYAYVASMTAMSFSVIDITGIKAPTASIGNIQTEDISVGNNINIVNDTYIGNSLKVDGNSLFSGAMSIAGGLKLTDKVSTTSTSVGLVFDSNGTTEWTIKLQKSDNGIYFRDNDGNDGVVLAQDTTSWASASDERLKDNIMSLNVLDRIGGYRAVSFNWKDNGRHDIGAIAQELYDIFPEVVNVGSDVLGEDGEGAWSIQYSKLGALALQGVKELKQQLDVYNALLLTGGFDEFVGQMNQSNMLTFSQNVTFTNHVTFGIDNVGSAVILAGENAVRVEFSQEFTVSPIVNLTLASDVTLDTYFVESVDTTGFTIRIRPIQGQDVVINWHAFGQVSTQSSETIINNVESNSSSSDNLTDLANNYLEDNGLTLDDILTSSTDSNSTTSTDEVNNVIQEEIVVPLVTSTEENVIETTTSTNN